MSNKGHRQKHHHRILPYGEVQTVKDGANDLTTFSYDGFDRLSEVEFPLPTTGSNGSNPNDYESYGYDANVNLTSKRLRSGQSVTVVKTV